jgi:flagellar basal-body rod modification protein FlgD
MPVDAVGSGGALAYTRDTSKDASNQVVDTTMFLKLMVAQLKYQDPLEPQKDTAFVTQMAQMTTLQEIQSMNATLKNSQAYDMVGKEIYAEVLDTLTGETTAYFGLVDSVVIKDGIPYVVVGNQAINVSDVIQVFPEPVTETEEAEMAGTTNTPDTTETPDTTGTPDTTEASGTTGTA